MVSATLQNEGRVDELLAVLDADIGYVRQTLGRLDELRSLVIKRDEASLGRLLETIRGESSDHSVNESKRQSIRRGFAAAFECDVNDMTLSRLEAELSGEKRIEVGRRRMELRSLTEKLRKEHLRTAMLLSDCARFNSALLKGILELGRTRTMMYGSNGAAEGQTDSVFVSIQF